MWTAFVVSDVQTPIISCSRLRLRGFSCSLGLEEDDLYLSKTSVHGVPVKIRIFPKGNLFYLRPKRFASVQPEKPGQACFCMPDFYSAQPLTIASGFSSNSMRKVTSGQTDYWEFFAEKKILRRVHKRPRKFLFFPDRLPEGFTRGMLQKERRTFWTTVPRSEVVFKVEWDDLETRK